MNDIWEKIKNYYSHAMQKCVHSKCVGEADEEGFRQCEQCGKWVKKRGILETCFQLPAIWFISDNLMPSVKRIVRQYATESASKWILTIIAIVFITAFSCAWDSLLVRFLPLYREKDAEENTQDEDAHVEKDPEKEENV